LASEGAIPFSFLKAQVRGLRMTSREVIAALALLAVFCVGASWHMGGQVTDSVAVAIPAWNFVETGSFDVTEFQKTNPWLLDVGSQVRSNRAPGLIAVGVIAYAAASPWTETFAAWPATALAVVTSWLAVVIVALSAKQLRDDLFLPALVLLGVGTATWAVSADQLWPHGPAQLAVACSMWFFARDKDAAAGLAFAAGILIRPPIAVMAAVMGIGRSISERSWRPAIAVGIPSAAAAGLYMMYNKLLFGSWSPLAVYNPLGGLAAPSDSVDWARNTLAGLTSPRYGLLIWSPWILVALAGLPRVWKGLPIWVRWTPLAALLFLVVHYRINRVSGGLPYDYRYSLEAITLTVPLLVVSIARLIETASIRIVAVLAGASAVALQAVVVFLSACEMVSPVTLACDLLGNPG
jgi:hypothetical protein